MTELDGFFRTQRLNARRQEAFGTALGLCEARFQADNGQVPQMEQARRYAAHWDEMRREALGLLLWGKPGSGKTFAAACIANALLELEHPPTVRMTTLGTVLSRLPGLSAQEKETYLNGLQCCGLLILDDFGMERQTDYAREQVFQIINGRYLARKPLIVTTNLSLNELKHPADMAQQRIFDRVLELCVPVCFDGASLRRDRARRNLQRYRQLTEGTPPEPEGTLWVEADADRREKKQATQYFV